MIGRSCDHDMTNFSIAKKAIITRVHLIITILKLRPNNRFNLRSYREIQGYAIILSQNSRSLLTLLLSDLATFEDVMRIIWLRSTFLQYKNLQKFESVKKYQIIKVLEWLKLHNSFYHNISINYPLLNTWENKFIP